MIILQNRFFFISQRHLRTFFSTKYPIHLACKSVYVSTLQFKFYLNTLLKKYNKPETLPAQFLYSCIYQLNLLHILFLPAA